MSPRTEELAQRFWADARLPESYPRDIEHAVALVLPAAVVKLPRLNTTEVALWLSRNRIAAQVESQQADLMGCLIASRGHGLMFVCGGDEPDEQRLTVAHETAHFLRHYLIPRERVVQAMGQVITPVLDGDREATVEERVAGVLSGVRIGAHVHLLPRHGVEEGRVARAEDDADDLGLELVAPRDAVLAHLRTRHVEKLGPTEQRRALASRFGVPEHVFETLIEDFGRARPTSFLADAIPVIRRHR